MELLKIHKFLLLLCLFFFFQNSSSDFTPLDQFFINCGSSTSVDDARRNFTGDSSTNYLSASASIPLEDPNPSPNSLSITHTARVFTSSPSSYELPLQGNGTLVVRLHFFPFSSQNCNLSNAVFDVFVAGFRVLSSFSPRNASSTTPKEYFLKPRSTKLQISFRPSTDSFAFVNAIEVFTAPEKLIPEVAEYVASHAHYYGLPEDVLETLHRINMGGPKITPSNDTVWRTWNPDFDYLSLRESARQINDAGNINYQVTGGTPEIAPPAVYRTAQVMNKRENYRAQDFNITWLFPVSSHDKHLVRFHFCDFVSNGANQLVFNVYIGDYSAFEGLDLNIKTNGLAAPYYADFIAEPGSLGTANNSTVMKISVGPSEKIKNAILNGVEFMKVLVKDQVPQEHKKSHLKILIGVPIGGAVFLSIVVTGVVLAFKCMGQMKLKTKPKRSVMWSPLPPYAESVQTTQTKASDRLHLSLGLIISFAEIQSATDNFNANRLIGSGGFGDVYQGVLRDGTKIAVKRGNSGSGQGLHQFLAEITVLSKIHHRNLVTLIGYCEEQLEMILVYEFMKNGSLKDHLYGKSLPCLSWKQRLEICIGSARGIHYLHTFSVQGIIHRDVKSANILLDEKFSAKVSDFGLSRTAQSEHSDVLSSHVKGSFGYLDPEYFKTFRLTQKSDVYSFGVVLFEILCARPAINHSLPTEQVNLAEWALEWQKKGLLMKIIDSRLEGTINPNSLRKFGETAENCLAECGADRPTMGDVLWNLEYALQLQETALHREPHEDSTVSTFESPFPDCQHSLSTSRFTDGGCPNISSNGSLDASRAVFSQFIGGEGR